MREHDYGIIGEGPEELHNQVATENQLEVSKMKYEGTQAGLADAKRAKEKTGKVVSRFQDEIDAKKGLLAVARSQEEKEKLSKEVEDSEKRLQAANFILRDEEKMITELEEIIDQRARNILESLPDDTERQ